MYYLKSEFLFCPCKAIKLWITLCMTYSIWINFPTCTLYIYMNQSVSVQKQPGFSFTLPEHTHTHIHMPALTSLTCQGKSGIMPNAQVKLSHCTQLGTHTALMQIVLTHSPWTHYRSLKPATILLHLWENCTCVCTAKPGAAGMNV